MLAFALPVIVVGLLIVVVARGLVFARGVRDINEMIPYVSSLDESITLFERLLRESLDLPPCQLDWKQRKEGQHKRFGDLMDLLERFDHNAALFGAFARYEIRMLGKPGDYGDYGESVDRLLRHSWLCHWLVVGARVQIRLLLLINTSFWFLVPLRNLPTLTFCGQHLLREYGEIRGLALSLASRHGEHYYDNLLCAL